MRLRELVRTPELFVVVMEVVDGGELYEHIVHRRRLSEDDARGVLLQVLEGVEVLHAIGVMHRDLKPETILVVKRWEGNALPKAGPLEVKLTDFGLATEFSESWDTRAVSLRLRAFTQLRPAPGLKTTDKICGILTICLIW